MNPYVQFLLEDDPWSENWEPTPAMVGWFQRMLSMLREGAVWGVPGTGQAYQISHANKTVTLIHGEPNDPQHWHDKNKKTLARLGYRVLDGPGDGPDQMAFAESKLSAKQIVAELMEDMGVPFTKAKATLQYRPFMRGDDWKWFWVLLPEDGSKALATGEADSRALASTAARQEARKLNVLIGKVDVIEPAR